MRLFVKIYESYTNNCGNMGTFVLINKFKKSQST